MIYDCFTFFNELDLLELRLKTLDKVVDKFVLVESTKTHTGHPKELFYKKNKERFKEFGGKIIHVVVDDMPESVADAWEMEYFQRNAISRALENCKDEDYIIISDVDEIPRPECIVAFSGDIGFLKQDLFYYRFNCRAIGYPWIRSVMCKFKFMVNPQAMRDMAIREEFEKHGVIIANGGWHFSYLGSEEMIAKKLESFSEQTYNTGENKDPQAIREKIEAGADLFGRSEIVFCYLPLDDSFPEELRKNKERWSGYVKEVAPAELGKAMKKTMEKTDAQLKARLSFDHYGRYALMRDIVCGNRNDGEIFSVLDIGGRGNLMKEFLPFDKVSYLDPYVDTKDDNYVKGDGCDIPLPDNSFDWVVSADVFEHIPKEKRNKFLEENTRVAKRGVILAAPFHCEEVAEAEKYAAENYTALIGKDHQWLKEHIENGLPKEEAVESFLKEKGWQAEKIYNNRLLLWQIFIELSFFTNDFLGSGKDEQFQNKVREFNSFYNSKIFPSDDEAPAYRTVFLIKKDRDVRGLAGRKRNLRQGALLEAVTRGMNLLSHVNVERKAKIAALEEVLNEKNREISVLDSVVEAKHQEIQNMRASLRWRVPSFFYDLYKKRIKKAIPKSLFKATAPLTLALDVLQGKHRTQEVANTEVILLRELNSVKPIIFPKSDNPLVSIVIPAYNNWRYTYHCLLTLEEQTRNISYEVIISDDCSTDETPELFKGGKIENVVYRKNDRNLGFTGTCNAGAKIARGRYIVFLNNDTQILRNWLPPLVETFERRRDAGLVGSKLIYPSGKLQEAGGIVWKNENACNYGWGRDPDDYEFCYLKEVDYCSAASVIIRADLFKKLGGFDSLYDPAYYEDTDLAFRVRQAGYKVYFQPKSRLIHFEGIANGRDVNMGLKKYQEVNKKKFFTRWKDVLDRENCDEFADGHFLARDRSKNKKVLLYVEHMVPQYDKDAGSFITLEYLKIMLALGYKVIYWCQNLAKINPYTEELQQMGIEVVYGRRTAVSFKEFILANGKHIDVSVIARPEVAKDFLPLIKTHTKARTIYLAHDLHYLRHEREAEVTGDKEIKERVETMRAVETGIIKDADITAVFSPDEAGIIQKEYPDRTIRVFPWIQRIEAESKKAEYEERSDLLFLGSSHPPNIDGILWFHKEIFPRIKKQLPDVKIAIVGSNLPKKIKELNSQDFQVLGFKETLAPLFDSSRVFVAPLRYGAGFKGKVAMAMSYGLPLVTTTIGAEGIGLSDGENAFIADDPKVFAAKVVELYKDKELWDKMSRNSLNHVARNYSVENARGKLKEVLE